MIEQEKWAVKGTINSFRQNRFCRLLSGFDVAVKSDKACDDAMRAGRWEEVIQTKADPFDTKFCHA